MVQEYDEASRGKQLPEAVEKQATFVMYTLGKIAANALGAVPAVFKPVKAIAPRSSLLQQKTPRLPSTPPTAPKASAPPGVAPTAPSSAATSARPPAGPSSSSPAMGGTSSKLNEPLGGGAGASTGTEKALEVGGKLTGTDSRSTFKPYV
jgi:hypothetical protein